MHIDLIELELKKARKILTDHWEDIDSIFFRDFPRGCCGNTSDILGKWLSCKGVVGLESVTGTRNGASHAWLEINGIILDITSDQFSDGCGEIFIGSNSKFHSSFESQERGPIGMADVMWGSYQTFCELMANA